MRAAPAREPLCRLLPILQEHATIEALSSLLACSVRGCGLPLERRDRLFVCARRHTYDVARSGYVNLLQPQDRRSPAAGDTKDAVDARTRLFAAGIGRSIAEAVAARIDSAIGRDQAAVVDLGCGAGDLLGAVAARRPIDGVGIDLSTAAAGRAAKRFPALTWVVANVDRKLPLRERCIDVAVSLHARRNPAECARLLGAGGALLIAVPAADDLVELRERVQGARVERERGPAIVAEHEPLFRLVERLTVRERHHLGAEALRDLLRGTYRGRRASEAARVEALDSLDVTVASEIFLFVRSA
jgi:23S rRNA (guanine745-N1)-methyltransferase